MHFVSYIGSHCNVCTCVCVCVCLCFTLINDVVYMYLSYCNAVNYATLLCNENFHGQMISLEFARIKWYLQYINGSDL